MGTKHKVVLGVPNESIIISHDEVMEFRYTLKLTYTGDVGGFPSVSPTTRTPHKYVVVGGHACTKCSHRSIYLGYGFICFHRNPNQGWFIDIRYALQSTLIEKIVAA